MEAIKIIIKELKGELDAVIAAQHEVVSDSEMRTWLKRKEESLKCEIKKLEDWVKANSIAESKADAVVAVREKRLDSKFRPAVEADDEVIVNSVLRQHIVDDDYEEEM